MSTLLSLYVASHIPLYLPSGTIFGDLNMIYTTDGRTFDIPNDIEEINRRFTVKLFNIRFYMRDSYLNNEDIIYLGLVLNNPDLLSINVITESGWTLRSSNLDTLSDSLNEITYASNFSDRILQYMDFEYQGSAWDYIIHGIYPLGG